MNVFLFRHKELLKKDILKKRALLEKELSIDIQVKLIFKFLKHVHFHLMLYIFNVKNVNHFFLL